jgi:hypothetical protein
MTVIGGITFKSGGLTFTPSGASSVLQQAQAQLVIKF